MNHCVKGGVQRAAEAEYEYDDSSLLSEDWKEARPRAALSEISQTRAKPPVQMHECTRFTELRSNPVQPRLNLSQTSSFRIGGRGENLWGGITSTPKWKTAGVWQGIQTLCWQCRKPVCSVESCQVGCQLVLRKQDEPDHEPDHMYLWRRRSLLIELGFIHLIWTEGAAAQVTKSLRRKRIIFHHKNAY